MSITAINQKIERLRKQIAELHIQTQQPTLELSQAQAFTNQVSALLNGLDYLTNKLDQQLSECVVEPPSPSASIQSASLTSPRNQFIPTRDRKEAELALKQSEANLFALIENTKDLIWSVDANYVLIICNSAFKECFYQNYDRLLETGLKILDCLPSDAKNYWKNLYDRALKGEHFSIEHHSQRSFPERYLEISFNPIRCDDINQIVGVSVFSRDITIWKQAQAVLETANNELELKIEERTIELKRTIEQLSQEIQERQRIEVELKLRDRAVFASNNGIVICDAQLPDNPIIFANPAFEAMTGYLHAEVLGRNCRFLQGENTNELELQIVREAIKAGKSCTVTLQNYRKDGSLFWNELSIAPIYDAEGKLTHFVGIQTDITGQKQVEDEIRNAFIKERELSELKSRFISMTSHEFRTPLTVILSSAALLENYSHQWNQERKMTHYQRIQIAGKRMTDLLNDVLTLNKAESNKLEFQPTSINVVQVCQQLIEDLCLTGEAKHRIEFVWEGQDFDACVDIKLLEQILHNLLSNALKYSYPQGIINFRLKFDADVLMFQVQDQGIGIPDADLPRIFESFHRGSNVGTISGTGLGLAIVKKCIDLQGGTISVTSEEGLGTLFEVKIPPIQMSLSHDENFSN